MAKYKITGIPAKSNPETKLNFTLGPVDRKDANVEAELGETVVTNTKRGQDNIFEMYKIGGKKHYDGGTPLNLATDGDGNDGTSFIFSDNKKMVVKDPAILEYFGVDPNKPKTYADISKTWLDAVNKSKQIIKDDVSDKIAKKSAEMTMDNAAFKIAALKLKQEAHKGMKDGVPNGMSPFFDKLQIDPSEMFAMNQDDTDKANEAVKSAFGGIIKEADGGPMVNPWLYTYNQGDNAQIIGGGANIEHKSGLHGGANLELPFNNRNAQRSFSQNIGFGKTFETKNGATFRGDATLNNSSNPEMGNFNPSANLSFNYEQPIGENTTFDLGIQNNMYPGSPFNPTAQASLKYNFSEGGELNKFALGDEVSKETTAPKQEPLTWGNADPKSVKQYNYIVNVLANNPNFKKALFEEYKRVAADEGNFGSGYNKAFKENPKNKDLVVRKTEDQVFNDYLDFQKRNLMLKSHGLDVAGTKQSATSRKSVSNKDITEWSAKHGVPLPNMDNAAAQQLSFIAFTELTKNKDKYDKELKDVMKPFGINPYGKKDERIAGSKEVGDISPADGAYTNTTAGEISWFTEPTPEDEQKIEAVQAKYTPKAPNYTHLNAPATLENPYAFRREDVNALQRAVQARWEIPELHPYTKVPKTVLPDRAYYSPERTIAAKNQQYKMMLDSQNAFGNAQAAGATAMALSGQAYNDVANAISDYADKNVGIFNAGEQYNTQLANQANLQNSQIATNMWDKENTLKQNLANSISAAKDKITQLSNQAYTNASNIYNLNLTNENFKKDPFTGLISKVNDKPFAPTQDNTKSFGEEFNTFASSLPPNITPDLQMKAFLAMKSGKYVIEKDDEVTKPNELSNQNTWS